LSRPAAPPTRERILDVALKLFAERGFAGTAVTDIEAGAGLSPGSGSFYRHFRSKEDVLDAVVAREIERARADRAVRPSHEASQPLTAEALAERLVEGFDLLDRMRPLMAILSRDHGRFPDLVRQIRDLLVEGGIEHAASALSPVSPAAAGAPEAVGSVVQAAQIGYYLSAQFFGTPPGGVDREQFARTLAELVIPPER
jgi:AcrR family transcriptional regulator